MTVLSIIQNIGARQADSNPALGSGYEISIPLKKLQGYFVAGFPGWSAIEVKSHCNVIAVDGLTAPGPSRNHAGFKQPITLDVATTECARRFEKIYHSTTKSI